MGGPPPPLGYDVKDRKLVINNAEADTVRHSYRRYIDLGAVRELQIELDRSGTLSKRRLDLPPPEAGHWRAVRSITCCRTGPIEARLYTRRRPCPGRHEAIVDKGLEDSFLL